MIVLGRRGKKSIGNLSSKLRDTGLFDKAEKEESRTGADIHVRPNPPLKDLGEKGDRADDRTRNQWRKKGDKKGEIQKTFQGIESTPIDIDRVTHGLESVKANPIGQNNLQGMHRSVKTKPLEKCPSRSHKKVEVFKVTKHPEIHRQADY